MTLELLIIELKETNLSNAWESDKEWNEAHDCDEDFFTSTQQAGPLVDHSSNEAFKRTKLKYNSVMGNIQLN